MLYAINRESFLIFQVSKGQSVKQCGSCAKIGILVFLGHRAWLAEMALFL